MKLKYNFDGYEHEYEPDNILDLLFELFKDEYSLNHITAKYIVDDFKLWDDLEDIIGEKYIDEIKEHFEDEAREDFEEAREYAEENKNL
jgi:hypothetical protein